MVLHLAYNIKEKLDCIFVKIIYNILHTNNSTIQSIVNSKLGVVSKLSVEWKLYTSCDSYIDRCEITAMRFNLPKILHDC